ELFGESVEPRGMLAQPVVDGGGGGDRGRSAGCAVLVQGVGRQPSKLRQARGVTHCRALRAECLGLAELQVGLAELFELPPQILLLPLPAESERFDVTHHTYSP